MTFSDPQSLKQLIDCLGYSIMGLVGVLGAWQRMRSINGSDASADADSGRKRGGQTPPTDRLNRMEQDLQALRRRHEEFQKLATDVQGSLLKQQTAIFDLLVQQRTVLDKMLSRLGLM